MYFHLNLVCLLVSEAGVLLLNWTKLLFHDCGKLLPASFYLLCSTCCIQGMLVKFQIMFSLFTFNCLRLFTELSKHVECSVFTKVICRLILSNLVVYLFQFKVNYKVNLVTVIIRKNLIMAHKAELLKALYGNISTADT